MTPTYIILAVLGTVVLWAIVAYNGFVTLVNRTKEAWADIDVQLKRRYDLIPNLKANQNFLSLQAELSDTENKIQAARRFYNGNVRDLNTSIESFPGNVIAGMFNFAKQEFFVLNQNTT